MHLPTIALVGRPNVGKSTLFNYLSKSRQALVADFAGLTRDRQYAQVFLNNDIKCTVIDTGGFNSENDKINECVRQQISIAIEEADIIYFMVSAQDGLNVLDIEFANSLKKLKKNIILICNKARTKDISTIAEFYKLGLGEPMSISAIQGQGINKLIAKTLVLLPTQILNQENILSSSIVVAILGRPNTGKSTLINQILKKERMLTLDVPGTTRDSIYIHVTKNNQKYTLIDTAGVRRKSNINNKIEKFSIVKTIEAIQNSHVVILVLDALVGVDKQDASLLGMIADRGKALIIAVNKWDGLDDYQKQEIQRRLKLKLSFISYANINYISALKNLGIDKLFTIIKQSYENAGAKFATPLINKILKKANNNHKAPVIKGIRPKIKYAHQSGIFPPTFTMHGNRLEQIPPVYERYLKNFFIKELKLKSTTINLNYQSTKNPYKAKKNIPTAKQINKKRLIKFNKSKKSNT